MILFLLCFEHFIDIAHQVVHLRLSVITRGVFREVYLIVVVHIEREAFWEAVVPLLGCYE